MRSPEGLTAHVQYVLNISNMSSKPITQAKQRFIDDVARLLVPWGVPQTAARIHGYLLLSPEPVTLDRIAADLEVSKSGASVAARLLEKYGLAVRHSERGSKRALYEVAQNYDGMLIEQSRLIDATAQLFKRGATTVASGKVKDRLNEMVEFYLAIGQAMDAALQSWRARS
jgi:DNA-binding transcriptional regulator GbsR (MarR family)